MDANNAQPLSRFEVKAPHGAPNVLIILIDDMGFGMSDALGGPIHMPNATQLGNDGLRYNQFHTTALSSPTRAALMSGRNHHMNNFGSIAESATAFPGQTGSRPNSVDYTTLGASTDRTLPGEETLHSQFAHVHDPLEAVARSCRDNRSHGPPVPSVHNRG